MDLMDMTKRKKAMLLCLALAAFSFVVAQVMGAYDQPAHELLERQFMILIFGFAGCAVLIVMAKLIMSPLLQRDEDYYQKGDDDADV